jgi:hypothetical protein
VSKSLNNRIARLEGEDDSGPLGLGVAEYMELARRRLRAMSPEAREAERRERYLHALNSPPPTGRLELALHSAARRMARFLGIAGHSGDSDAATTSEGR